MITYNREEAEIFDETLAIKQNNIKQLSTSQYNLILN